MSVEKRLTELEKVVVPDNVVFGVNLSWGPKVTRILSGPDAGKTVPRAEFDRTVTKRIDLEWGEDER